MTSPKGLSWWRAQDARLKAWLAGRGRAEGDRRGPDVARRAVALAWIVLGVAFLLIPGTFVLGLLADRFLPPSWERALMVGFLLVDLLYEGPWGLFLTDLVSGTVLPFVFFGYWSLFVHAFVFGFGLVALGRRLWRGGRGAAGVSILLLAVLAVGSALAAAFPDQGMNVFGDRLVVQPATTAANVVVAFLAAAGAWALRPLARGDD